MLSGDLEDPVRAELFQISAAYGLPNMHLSASDGKLLTVLTALARPQLTVEFGTFLGYSTICMARALEDKSRIITFERHPEHARLARETFLRGRFADRIELIEEDALAGTRLTNIDQCEMCFVDASWSDYPYFVEWAIRNVTNGGLVVLHNAGIANLGPLEIVDPQLQAWLQEDTLSNAEQLQEEVIAVRLAIQMLCSSASRTALVPSREGMLVALLN